MDISAKPWTRAKPPKRILAIRLQAMGDVVITLPYLQHLRQSLPHDTVLDLLTREEVQDIPKAITLFNNVYAIGGERSFKRQLLSTLVLLPRLLFRRYDAVIDLQNNVLSRLVRKCISPTAWTEFDRYSPLAAGDRNRNTIEAIGLGKNKACTHFDLKGVDGVSELLQANGWKPGADIIVLNPAGAFENRNWPVESYIAFAQMWMEEQPPAQFLVMGIDKISGKAEVMKRALGDRLINLVNKTNAAMAFAIMQQARFVLSEDSGMMHMGWVSGIPTLAMFGSTRSDWSRPLGVHTDFVDSSDMACGNCMKETCIHDGDKRNLCMMRFSAELIYKRAMALLAQLPPTSKASS